MTDIRVFVAFQNPGSAVFAGEKLECRIIFRNIAPLPGTDRPGSQQASQQNQQHGQQNQKQQANGYAERVANKKSSLAGLSASERARPSVISPRIPPVAGSRRKLSSSSSSSSSLFMSGNSVQQKSQNSPALPNGSAKPDHKHKRSISIISIGSNVNEGGEAGESQGRSNLNSQVRVPIRGRHGRSSSLQYPPPKTTLLGSAGLGGRTTPQTSSFAKSPQSNTPTIKEPDEDIIKFTFPAMKSPVPPAVGETYAPTNSRHARQKSLNRGFQFPSPVLTDTTYSSPKLEALEPTPAISPLTVPSFNRAVANIDLRSPLDGGSEDEQVAAKFPPNFNVVGDTPRSSGEFYSLANNTTDTLVSDYDGRFISGRLRARHSRRHSLLSPGSRPSETLMMGYAQVSGAFILDASLVKTEQFEYVKRKGVVGGQGGGGVVGLETKNNDGKLLGGFGWGSFGGAIGNLLGGNNMSSIAEMKNIASSRSIPILSTPQSILFVDLQLGPGESRTYNFSFLLPRRLPPSHRGKAIKVSYVLRIGTQRAGKGVQQPKVVEIPFRVFPNVDVSGSLHTHDLMSPIVLLKDEAAVTCVEETPTFALATKSSSAANTPHLSISLTTKPNPKSESSLDDFLSYVDVLLAPVQQQKHLLSPNPRSPFSPGNVNNHNHGRLIIPPLPTPKPRTQSIFEELSSKENIELALFQGATGRDENGYSTPDGRCSIYEIKRNGLKVASLTLARPAYKLGDTIVVVIDFEGGVIPCYHIHATLETAELVSPELALRSPSSILRVTRKVHAIHSENTLFAKRIIFSPTIPPTASPEFNTTVVSLSWRLNIEFVTPVTANAMTTFGSVQPQLLEQTHVDDRGELFEARQVCLVESFDAVVPVRVYPNAYVNELGIGGGAGSSSWTVARDGRIASGGGSGGGAVGSMGLGTDMETEEGYVV